jgi:heme A synthase
MRLLLTIPAAAALAGVAAGLPRAGAFGSPAGDALAALGLQLTAAVLALAAFAPWRAAVQRFGDSGWPSLRSMAWFTPLAVAGQVSLGAAYRYELTGIVPHIAWAFLTSIVLLMLSIFVLTQPQAGRALKRIAGVLAGLICAQVVLGVAALLARVSSLKPAAWMTVATSLHLLVGGLIFALSLVLAALVLRSVEQPA